MASPKKKRTKRDVEQKFLEKINKELNARIRECYWPNSNIQKKETCEYISGMYTGLIMFRDYLETLGELKPMSDRFIKP